MNAQDLKNERERRQETQDETAAFLGVPVSSYRKWEQGQRKVPVWVPEKFAPKSLIVEGLTLDELAEIDQLARESGMSFNAMISTLLKSGLTQHPTSKKRGKKEG